HDDLLALAGPRPDGRGGAMVAGVLNEHGAPRGPGAGRGAPCPVPPSGLVDVRSQAVAARRPGRVASPISASSSSSDARCPSDLSTMTRAAPTARPMMMARNHRNGFSISPITQIPPCGAREPHLKAMDRAPATPPAAIVAGTTRIGSAAAKGM